MKKLQNHFTTPEQSKRLLALGVLADSADCYYTKDERTFYGPFVKGIPCPGTNDLPCWSVGRLQEIAKICAKEKEYYYASLDTVAHQEDFAEWWVKHFTLTDNVLFDFSKLDE